MPLAAMRLDFDIAAVIWIRWIQIAAVREMVMNLHTKRQPVRSGQPKKGL